MGNAERYRKTFPVTWDQLHRDAKALAWRLLEYRNFKSIVAITRGGLVPAAIIARELNIRMIDTVCIVTSSGRNRAPVKLFLRASKATARKCWSSTTWWIPGARLKSCAPCCPGPISPPYTPNPPDVLW